MEKQKTFEPISLILIILLYALLMYPLSSISKDTSERKLPTSKAVASKNENAFDAKTLTQEKSKRSYLPYVRDANSGL